ncbi:MAG: excinuclease ABC subunit UvrA [Bacteroidota bacterium]
MPNKDFNDLDPKKYILIKNSRVNNLKDVSVALPKNKFIVITGLSGSGKTSLAFDTLFAEGQRRYVESLSSYARQFLGRMHKPEVDYIRGISPAIAIQQKVISRNPRSTVGTSTEIYEYLKLLYARIGITYSPVSNKEVKRDTVTDVINFITSQALGRMIIVSAPFKLKKDRKPEEQLKILKYQGFTRLLIQNEIFKIDELLTAKTSFKGKEVAILVDRIEVNMDDETISRIGDSVQLAFYEGNGFCNILFLDSNENHSFSNRFELDGKSFEEPSVNLFSFNNPYGACKKCEGFGNIIGIDEDLVIPNKNLSIYEEAIVCWKGEKMSEWKNELVMNAYKFDFPIHTPIYELTPKQYKLLWTGNSYFQGINDFFKYVEEQTYKIQYRVMLSRYRGRTVCPECKGTRLRIDASYVRISGKSLLDLVLMSIDKLKLFFKALVLTEHQQKVADRLLLEINNRLGYLSDVGLGYLTLNRLSNSLSGGESQRINLATSLGSNLVGAMYILDEPSIGLHPRDTKRLIDVLISLRDIGNTVIVVEHDEEIIRNADFIIDIGPYAGQDGGEVMFEGTFIELTKSTNCLTADYINGRELIPIPEFRRKWKEFIEITGARENNLKNFNVKFPLQILTVVTGVSGSGKTSLIKKVLYTALKKNFDGLNERSGTFSKISGDIDSITNVELIDQNPIGRSTRSNPAAYMKAWDEIRTLYANQALSKMRGYKTGFFSFNTTGGRCEECEGEGFVNIEMQFMADVQLICETCNGKRFKDEILEINYNGKNINDLLNLTINETIDFFTENISKSNVSSKIVEKLRPLQDVGLGYLRMGQSSSTLSGGEAQRIKLASFLTKGASDKPMLFIFDEPTTGLHFHDIHKLLHAFNALLNKGHSIIVIEHNPEIIKSADWIIDLGPEGGDLGGHVVFEGIPEELHNAKKSYTAKFLKLKNIKSKA